MKTDRQIGSKSLRLGKPAWGPTREPRRASSPRYALLPPPATHRRSLARLQEICRCVSLADHYPSRASGGRLIANLELEFNSTHRKHSPLKISNRKFLRVLRSGFSSLTITSCGRSVSEPSNSTLLPVRSSPGCQPPATAFLIYGSAIKNPANPQGFNDVRFSNRR
jgi:hypothetical protein